MNVIQMQQIQALRFDIEEVGKHVKGSKKRFTWDIALKDKHHTIVLDFSFISGKVKITVDRKILLQNELPSNVSFQYPFTLDGFALNLIQQGQTFELRLNNKVFSHLYTQQRTNTEFKRYEDQVKDIKVNFNTNNPPNQKISLNIGGMNMKKRQKKVGQSAGWDAFSGGSFPNYFGDQPQPTEQTKPQLPKIHNNLLDEDQESTSTQISPPKQEKSLLEDVNQSSKPQQQDLFDIGAPVNEAPQPSSGTEEFNTMQQMFATMNVSKQPPSKEVDFFSVGQESRQEPPPQSAISGISSGFDMNFSGNSHNFATGVAIEHSNLNSKSFATSSPGNPQVDFFNIQPQPQEQSLFAKKPSSSTVQQSSVLVDTPNHSKLTDLNINDFMAEKAANKQFQLPQNFGQLAGSTLPATTEQPNAGNFSTMQLLFQTNSGALNSQMGLSSVNSSNLNSSGINVSGSGVPDQNSFNTFQNLFQTSNPNTLMQNQYQLQKAPNLNEPKQSISLDFLKDNKPQNFATMSGGQAGNFEFNMAAFGTMQASSNKGEQQPNFNFGKKPDNSNADNLI